MKSKENITDDCVSMVALIGISKEIDINKIKFEIS